MVWLNKDKHLKLLGLSDYKVVQGASKQSTSWFRGVFKLGLIMPPIWVELYGNNG